MIKSDLRKIKSNAMRLWKQNKKNVEKARKTQKIQRPKTYKK